MTQSAQLGEDPTGEEVERITVIARDFTPAAMEFHRRKLGREGFTIEGPIGRHKFVLVEGPGEPTELFDGEAYFAATFIRSRKRA